MNREDLKNYLDNLEQLQSIEECIEELEKDIGSITARYSNMPTGSSKTFDKIGENIAKLEAERANLINQKIKLMNKRINVQKALMNMKGIYKEILELRYIKGYKLVEIAVVKKFSYDYIRQKHGKALCVFDNINRAD